MFAVFHKAGAGDNLTMAFIVLHLYFAKLDLITEGNQCHFPFTPKSLILISQIHTTFERKKQEALCIIPKGDGIGRVYYFISRTIY